MITHATIQDNVFFLSLFRHRGSSSGGHCRVRDSRHGSQEGKRKGPRISVESSSGRSSERLQTRWVENLILQHASWRIWRWGCGPSKVVMLCPIILCSFSPTRSHFLSFPFFIRVLCSSGCYHLISSHLILFHRCFRKAGARDGH